DIIWDLINEPTYGLDAQLWNGNIPTGSRSETKLWNEWLKAKYGDELIHLSGMLNTSSGLLLDGNSVKLPSGSDFEKSNIYKARQKPLIAYDYNLFAQYAYNSWAAKVRKIFRDEGSTQLITTGQDEGGITNRVQAQFYAETSDFTTQHSWWQDDDLLWDNLMAKTQNKPLLVQETNLMRYTDLRGNGRRSEQDYAKILERKICIGFAAEGAGVIPWVWDANTALNENESSIGLNRCDGTASPEKAMYKKFAKFVNRNAKYFTIAKEPEILLVIPFSLQFSNYQSLALTATKNAVRAMHYYARFKFNVASEYHLDRVTVIPKLVVLPSVQALTDTAWNKICEWVSGGTTLLITGPIDKDPHFESVKRLTELGVETRTEPVLQLNSFLTIGNERYQLNYYNTSAMQSIDQMVWKEDHGKIKEVTLGKGKILISEYPVELNTNLNTIAELYKYAAKKGNITSEFVTDCSNPGILIRPIDYEKARMYLLESETDTDEVFTIRDKFVNKDYSVKLEAGRAKLLLISKEDGKIIDQY
ncbi:MAG: hypothetical protein Q8905_08860, partial [Bacteroidota bacterium]|nr:hypothetical protein [Bacteroidota bacterium]